MLRNRDHTDYVRLLQSPTKYGGCAGSRLSRCYKTIVIVLLMLVGLFIYHVAINIDHRPEFNWAELSLNESCDGRLHVPRIIQRGRYWILPSYIQASQRFACDESVTYTTHGEATFLDNLDTLTARWQGPVSVAVYAPGSDFGVALASIRYLHECINSSLIRELVTFHLFFHQDHLPSFVPNPQRVLEAKVSCAIPPWQINATSYRKSYNMSYPVNVARNVARQHVDTHFVLPSDIELFPSLNLIPSFLEMIRRDEESQQPQSPKVYVLPVFEVKKKASVPDNKEELVALLGNKNAFPFHKKMCSNCHNYPGHNEWHKAMGNPDEMRVFKVGKRHKPFHLWEPIFIGTNEDPQYDERLSWEGKSDKMSQAYTMCLLDYEFHVLDTAFLVHKPGIKVYRVIKELQLIIARQSSYLKKVIYPELRLLYGTSPNCRTVS